MSLFQPSVLKKYLKNIDTEKLNNAWEVFVNHFHNVDIQENIQNSKEEQYQGEFLIDLFVKVLGYTKNPQPNFNLTTELKNEKDSKKVDGAILKDDFATAVIELKGMNTTDLSKIENQAFGYKNNQTNCDYVIISNFQKVRFYVDNAINFLEFDLFTLTKEDFEILWICLEKDNLLNGIPKRIKNESLVEEENVSKQLYKDYSLFRKQIFNNLVKNNPETDKLLLFQKTQKLLDRFLFIFFAEDRGLLPPNSTREILKQWKQLIELDEEVPLYDRFKKYFGYLDQGYNGKKYNVFAYNGGLFKPDDVLDTIKIDDDVLYEHCEKISTYDFQSEVDVNILGHIFENSLNEIEEMQAEINGEEVDKSNTKRKKDGVFYTPKYITKYIVENTVGKLCTEKKAELEIDEDEYFKNRKGRKKDTIKKLDEKLKAYRSWLLELTICDPACGSGAFLNQALEFLLAEHSYIDELESKLHGEGMILPVVPNDILENNLFGVDLNEESVEIAKLSLWLRTAKPNRKLNSLNNNIKCGNSLIDDPEVAGDKAFSWEKEFPKIFEKGGFDVVIGNPPYGIFMSENEQDYYTKHFPLTNYKINLYVLFIERMLQIFDKGIIHFIIPKSLLFNTYYKTIREALLKTTQINEIHTITEKVFEDAEVGSSLLLNFEIKKDILINKNTRLVESETSDIFISGIGITENIKSQKSFLSIPNFEISIIDQSKESIQKKLLKLEPIKKKYKLKNGLNPGNIKHILVSDFKKSEKYKPIIWGKNISKYHISWSGDYINYDEDIGDQITLDDIKSKQGMKKQNKIDFALRSPKLFENKKIVVRKTGDKLIASLDIENHYFDTLIHGIYELPNGKSLEALLAILNSKPATVFYRILHDIKGKVFAKISLDNLSSFPIPKLGQEIENNLSTLANKMLALSKELREISQKFKKTLQREFELEKISKKLESWYELNYADFLKELKKKKVEISLSQKAEWEDYFVSEQQKAVALKTDIDKTDNEIDEMVYELYGLTEEEIKIIKNN